MLKDARAKPQLIRTRGALVAAVLGPRDAEEFLAWKAERARPSVADLFADARAICADEGIEIEAPARRDRPNPMLPSRGRRPTRKTARRAR